MDVVYFASAEGLREWFERHHASESELWVGFYKKNSGVTGAAYGEAVDEALCFGWIDGQVRRVDEQRYTHRFTPRRRTSVWSQANIARVGELQRQGRMRPAGLQAFTVRSPHNTQRYSFENTPASLAPAEEAELQGNHAAWTAFERQAPSHQRAMLWWVTSAKRPQTRQRRLADMIDRLARGVPVPPFRTPSRLSGD